MLNYAVDDTDDGGTEYDDDGRYDDALRSVFRTLC